MGHVRGNTGRQLQWNAAVCSGPVPAAKREWDAIHAWMHGAARGEIILLGCCRPTCDRTLHGSDSRNTRFDFRFSFFFAQEASHSQGVVTT